MGIESLGIPVPGETSLLVGVFLATQGRLSVPVVALVAWVGRRARRQPRLRDRPALGHAPGAAARRRTLLQPGAAARAEAFFERRGWLAVFTGRFIALLRIFAGPLAGMHRMPWPGFFVANAAGGATWVAAIVVVGVLIGNNLDRAISLVGRVGYIGLGVAVPSWSSRTSECVVWRSRRAD